MNKNKLEVYLIKDTLTEIMELQNSIQINDLFFNENNYNFSNFSLPTIFSRDIYKRRLLTNYTD